MITENKCVHTIDLPVSSKSYVGLPLHGGPWLTTSL